MLQFQQKVKKMKILVVEDDQRVASFLVRGLKAEGYNTFHADNGQVGFEMALNEKPDLIILDRMLPVIDGIEVLQKIRAQKIPARIIILSALAQVNDRVEGLRMGADDYIAKPFEFEELLARVEAVARRNNIELATKNYKFLDLELNLETFEVHRSGTQISLTPKELAILELLISNPKKVFSRERILANVWEINEDPLTNIVDVYIKKLREKIDFNGVTPIIKTVRGFGYSLNDE